MAQNASSEQLKASESEQSSEKPAARGCLSDNCIQITAWVLLTVGLCIIISTFYLAIHSSHHSDYDDENQNVGDMPENNTNINSTISFNQTIGRIVDAMPLDIITGCEETACRIVCQQVDNVFEALYTAMNESVDRCNVIEMMIIQSQQFHRNVFKNSWIDLVGRSIHEVILMTSDVSQIRNGAFNSELFSDTFLLTLYKLNPGLVVEAGALLGLHSLKYLTIDTEMSGIDRSFFQPVQTSLTHLKLKAGLEFDDNQCVFGISELRRLEYADLSYNRFLVPLRKKMFAATPNLRYLIIRDAGITAIDEDAFESLAGKLNLLDLSHNLLTTVSHRVFGPLLGAGQNTFLNLAMNKWNCDCDMQQMFSTYTSNRGNFIEALFCVTPHNLHGTFFSDINFTTEYCGNQYAPRPSVTSPPPTIFVSDSPQIDNTDVSYTSKEMDKAIFQMRCLNAPINQSPNSEGESYISSAISTAISNPSETEGNQLFPRDIDETATVEAQLLQKESRLENVDYFELEPPTHDFELHLLENNSVQVISSITDANLIWFSDLTEDFHTSCGMKELDYNCMQYAEPYLTTAPLLENTTYTFCLMRSSANRVAPFDCLPLFVPHRQVAEDNVWISKDEKEFTIGMLCLLFTLSTFFGAVVAYFGIKSYPDLLEGSKNVLVVKKSDQTCYVATISDSEYINRASLKKRPLSGGLSLTKTPTRSSLSEAPATPPTFNEAIKNLDRLPSVKSAQSSSTLFEDSFPPINLLTTSDEYEMPKVFDKSYSKAERSVQNNYAESPRMAPPLPKRNSSIPESVNFLESPNGSN